MAMELEVVTVDIRARGGTVGVEPIRLLADSSRRNGYRLSVLGPGEDWGGFGTKLCLLRRHLRSVPDSRPVLFLDAYDTVLLPCRDRLLRGFLSCGAPLLFGAEAGCWPDPALAPLYPAPGESGPAGDPRIAALRPTPTRKSPFRYLNSGTYIGLAGAIREALEELSPRPEDDDQRLYTGYFLNHPDRVRLDAGAFLFHNLFRVNPDDLIVERARPVLIRSRWTGSEPCVLHGNGPGRSTLSDVAGRLREFGWP